MAPLAKTALVNVHVSMESAITSLEIALVIADTLELCVTMVNELLYYYVVLSTEHKCSVLFASVHNIYYNNKQSCSSFFMFETDCTISANCTAVNREPCSLATKENYCGPCLAGHVGDEGDGNTYCTRKAKCTIFVMELVTIASCLILVA